MAHLVPKDLIELPYVDRVPNPSERPDQRRIEWIRNGDCLGAAEHAADNSGELNRGPVQVQKNAVTLLENDRIIDESLKEIITRVNAHDDALGDIGDDNLATKLDELEIKVEPLEAKILKNTQDLFLVGEAVSTISTNIGTKPLLDIQDRTLYEDIFWTKKEIGNWAGKDVNDNDNPLIVNPTGLKARIVAQGLGISANERRIVKLESDWIQSDVGALTAEIQNIRGELGRVSDAPALGVYRWILNANQVHGQYDSDIAALKNAVGGGAGGETLDERITRNTNRVEANELNIASNSTSIDRIVGRLGDSTTQGSIDYKISKSEMAITGLQTIVGENEDSGLQKSVQDIKNEVGTDALAGSLKGRLAAVESTGLDTQREVATITTKIGDSTAGSETGIYRRLMTIETNLNEPNTGLNDSLTALKAVVALKPSEAPEDGNIYGRKDGTWERIAGGGAGGIQDAPNDGKQYVRKSENWFELNSEGVILPEGQKLETMQGPSKLNLLARYANNIVMGEATSEITLSGRVKSFRADATFTITSSDATNANIVSSEAGKIVIGDTATQTVLKSGNTPLVVEVESGDKHQVIHAGNIIDYVPIRIHGGYHVMDNTTETATNATPTEIKLDNSKVTTLALNTPDVGQSDGKLTFEPRTIRAVLNAVVELRVETTEAAPIKFELVDTGGTTIFARTIEADEWTTGKKAVLRMQGPTQIGVSAEELSIKVSCASGTPSVTVSDGMFYVHSI